MRHSLPGFSHYTSSEFVPLSMVASGVIGFFTTCVGLGQLIAGGLVNVLWPLFVPAGVFIILYTLWFTHVEHGMTGIQARLKNSYKSLPKGLKQQIGPLNHETIMKMSATDADNLSLELDNLKIKYIQNEELTAVNDSRILAFKERVKETSENLDNHTEKLKELM